MFKWLFSDKPETAAVQNTAPKQAWRPNMWVATPEGVGILFEMTEPCRVHLVDETGVTTRDVLFDSSLLRQAKYHEIPASRRGDEDKAKALGYL